MRKDKRGQPLKIELKKRVADLRKLNYSYSEIADSLKISRQLAFYHYKIKGLDKRNIKE